MLFGSMRLHGRVNTIATLQRPHQGDSKHASRDGHVVYQGVLWLADCTLAYILQHAIHIVQQCATSVLRENMLGIIIRWHSSKRITKCMKSSLRLVTLVSDEDIPSTDTPAAPTVNTYKDLSLELVPSNLTIRYFHFLELFLTYMRI
jgi:hypothetical protein